MTIISMAATEPPQVRHREKGYRLGWDYGTGEFVVYLDGEEVARMRKETSRHLLEEIRTRDSNGELISALGKPRE